MKKLLNDSYFLVRRSRALILSFNKGKLIAYNFITHQSFCINHLGVQVLQEADQWQELGFIVSKFSDYKALSVLEQLLILMESGGLV